MLIVELNTNQILEVEFDNCNLIKNMLQTCYAFPEDYPTVEFAFKDKTFKAWFVGYKATGNRVFILKNGTCITEELKRIKDLSTIIWRIRLEHDWNNRNKHD
jgi:hypothetical protein